MPVRRIGIFSQIVPPKSRWTADKVPDQTGRISIITGGHADVGKETARMLLSKGGKVYIATVDGEKARDAIDELKDDTGNDSVCLLNLDLANLDSVKEAADEFMRKEFRLHTLYNNKLTHTGRGVTYARSERETVQGFDYIFGTNVLGHFYLTKLLLPVLTATAEKAPEGTVRVVNISSIAHYKSTPEGIRWATLGPGAEALAARRKLGMARVYGQSKLGNILFSNEFARRYANSKIVSISLFPGAVNADLSGYAGSVFQRSRKLVRAWVYFLILCGDLEALTGDLQVRTDEFHSVGGIRSESEDAHSDSQMYHRAITSLYAGTSPEASRLNGRYLTAWARVTLPSKKALDARLAAKLWDWCEDKIEEVSNPYWQ